MKSYFSVISNKVRWIYFGLSVAALLVITWINLRVGETNLPPLQPLSRLGINTLFLNLALSYYLLITMNQKNPVTKKTWFFFAIIGFFLCSMHPVFSGDLMEYLVRGRILAIYHESPYVHVPAEYPQDILYSFSTWKDNPDSYGPLFVWLEALPAVLFGDSVKGMVWCLKAELLIFLAVAIFYFIRIAKKIFPGAASVDTIVLFAFNPLLIVSTLIDGHNDTVMLCFTLMAFYYLMEQRFLAAFFFWALAFLVKYTVVLILPFFVVALFTRAINKNTDKRALFVMKPLAVAAITILVSFLPLWGGSSTFLALTRASVWFYTNTLPYAFNQLLNILGIHASTVFLKYAFLGLFFVGYAVLLWRFWKEGGTVQRSSFWILSMVYLFFYLTITIPFGFHYLLWALPWIILADFPKKEILVTLYSFAGLFSYFKRMNYLLILAAMLYLVILWIGRLRRPARVST